MTGARTRLIVRRRNASDMTATRSKGQERRRASTRGRPAVPAVAALIDSADPGVPAARTCGPGPSTRIPAASVSSPTSRAASRTRCRRRARDLCNLEHRGAVGADPRAGDGAGILVQTPHTFFARKTENSTSSSPIPANTQSAFFSCRDPNGGRSSSTPMRRTDPARRPDAARLAQRAKRQLDAWRSCEADRAVPQQVIVGRGTTIKSEDEFERRLYILRKSFPTRSTPTRAAAVELLPGSMSCRTVVYKGMFLADQLGGLPGSA